MGLADLTDRKAVLRAVYEFDQIGRDAFLERYGFGRARHHFLKYEGNLYDSKAIVGAAHQCQHPSQGRFGPDQFYGRRPTIATLERLGFEIYSERQTCVAAGHASERMRIGVPGEFDLGTRSTIEVRAGKLHDSRSPTMNRFLFCNKPRNFKWSGGDSSTGYE